MLSSFIKTLKSFMLLIALAIGASCFFLFEKVDFLHPYAQFLGNIINYIVPCLIFTMLFLAFLKVKLDQMKLNKWHFILISLDYFGAFLIALYLFYIQDTKLQLILYGALACMVVPTAAAASVIANKIGGSQSKVTSYILINNIVAAIFIPLIFPLAKHSLEFNFIEEFLDISYMTLPMLVSPLIIAIILKKLNSSLASTIVLKAKDLSFYLWCSTLSVVAGKAVATVYFSKLNFNDLIILAIVGLVICLMHFIIGRLIGYAYGYKVSAGQSFGQKNMVFGIYLATSYLNPQGAITTGFYILWQNIVNSYQIYKKSKNDKLCIEQNIKVYQEE